MVKECNVVYHNKFLNIVVFKFDDKEIQMTLNIPEGTKKIYIKYENKKYSSISKQEYIKSISVVPKNTDKQIKQKISYKSE